MDVFEFAMQMEKDGEKYYREMMQISKTVGLQKIFGLLADEEVKHCLFLEQLRRNTGPQRFEGTPILKNVKNVFIEMREEKNDPPIDLTDATIAYRKALDIEEMSRRFYLEKAEEADDDQTKLLLTQLAKEEEKHVRIMENIIEFVSRPEPGSWLENAEWHHLDEY